MSPWPDTFDARQIAPSPWQVPIQVQEVPRPDFADNEELKTAFGVALGRGCAPFDAGLDVFDNDTAKGLWAATNWIKDPCVIAAKDAYLKALKKQEKPLDKEELLAEVLGSAKIAPDFKDKATLFKLYAEIAGFTGKAAEAPLDPRIVENNLMKIVFVKPDDKMQDAANIVPNAQSKMQNEIALPKLKLVGGSG